MGVRPVHVAGAAPASVALFLLLSYCGATDATLPLMTRAVYVEGHLVPHPELCPEKGERLELMIFVASAPANVEKRTSLRRTWGYFTMRSDVSLAFLVGTTRDAVAQAALAAEDAVYGDVVRADFVDTYTNVTLKLISMLEWVSYYCPRARLLLKADDDIFLNVPRLLAFAERPDTRTIYGYLYGKRKAERDTNAKYYISQLQYPDMMFPEFMCGISYLLTGDCVRPLYERALTNPFVWIEDVYVTGVLAEQLKIRRVHSEDFGREGQKRWAHPCDVQRGISIHGVSTHEQLDLWSKLFDTRSKCPTK